MSSAQGGSADSAVYDVVLKLRQPLPQSQVRVHFDQAKFDVKPSLQYATKINETWLKRLQNNPRLYNASKFRFCTAEESVSDATKLPMVTLGIGLCDYATYLGTNRNSDEELVSDLQKEGLSLYDDSSALFANPFGNAALIVTSDGCIPFFRRSFHTAEFALWWDVPGGHPEPSRVPQLSEATVTTDDLNELVNSELFASVIDEVHTELNVPLVNMAQPKLIGIVRAQASRGRPSAVFRIDVSMTSSEIAAAYKIGGSEADESTVLAFVPHDVAIKGYGNLSMVVQGVIDGHTSADFAAPTTFQEVKNLLVPTAAFAFELVRRGEIAIF